MNPTVEEILRDWLKQHGYDGLRGADVECGCSLDHHFIPCGEVDLGCEAGYKGPDPSGECDFLIYAKKPKKVEK